MKTKISQAVIGGLVGTAAMTMIMYIAPMMGMPKMSPPAMLSMMMGVPLFAGWIGHFMIGIIFTLMYAFLLFPILKKVSGRILKGIIFGLAAFVFAQIAIGAMGAILGNMPAPEGNMVLIAMGSMIGHLVFGIVAAQFVAEK